MKEHRALILLFIISVTVALGYLHFYNNTPIKHPKKHQPESSLKKNSQDDKKTNGILVATYTNIAPTDSSNIKKPDNERLTQSTVHKAPENNVEILWIKHSKKLPKLHSHFYRKNDLSNSELNEIKEASNLSIEISKARNVLYKEAKEIKDADIPIWKENFNAVLKDSIKAIKMGDAYAAWWLGSDYLGSPIRDEIEWLTWAMIATAMDFQTNSTQVCELIKSPCSDELFKSAFDRAIFYIEYYEFTH